MFKEKKWLYPIYCLAIILAYIGLSYSPMVFNDYVWHIKAGEWMIENGKILKTNIFSWFYPEDKFLFSHEWLAEIFIYLFKQVFKFDYLFLVFCMLLVLIPLFIIIKKEFIEKDLLTVAVVSFLIMMAFSTSLYARPFFFGLFFFILLVKALTDIKEQNNSKFYLFFPLIAILWTNMHGGTILFALIGPVGYLIGSLFNFESKRVIAKKGNSSQRKKYLYLLIGNALAALVNPSGIKMYYYSFAINNSQAKAGISEWDPASINWTTCFISILVIIIFLILNTKKVDFTELLGLTMFFLLTCIYGRFYSWLTFYFLIVFLKYFNNKSSHFFEKEFALEIIVITIAVAVFTGTSLMKVFPTPEYEMSKNIIDTIKEIKPQRLFNSYDTGGFLAYKDIKVFGISLAELSTEQDCYVSKNVESFNINEALLEQYNFDYFLIDRKTVMYYHMKQHPEEFELITEDDEHSNTLWMYAIFKNLNYNENAEYDENNYQKGVIIEEN